MNVYDVRGVAGNGACYDVQREAFEDGADLLIATTSSDEINILACLVAKKIGTRHTIARIRNPEYERQLRFMRAELGLSMVINPEKPPRARSPACCVSPAPSSSNRSAAAALNSSNTALAPATAGGHGAGRFVRQHAPETADLRGCARARDLDPRRFLCAAGRGQDLPDRHPARPQQFLPPPGAFQGARRQPDDRGRFPHGLLSHPGFARQPHAHHGHRQQRRALPGDEREDARRSGHPRATPPTANCSTRKAWPIWTPLWR